MRHSLHTHFCGLHTAQQPLLLPNTWDAASAMLFEQTGATAVGTSSAALAWSCGYSDGGALPRQKLLDSIVSMSRVLTVPLTVDIEDGYSESPEEVAQLAVEVARAGAVGINIEDAMAPPALLAEKIRCIRLALAGLPLFINARTDVYLRGLATKVTSAAVTIERLKLYQKAGADGAFVPGLRSLDEVRAISTTVAMPLNVMLMQGLPNTGELHSAGVQRISVGPTPFQLAYGNARDAIRAFLARDFAPLLAGQLDYAAMNSMLSK